MRLFSPLFALLILLPIAEILLLIWFGQEFGWGETLFWTLGTAVWGSTIIRRQTQLLSAQNSFDAVADHLAMMLAGVLLVIPGLLTDLAGLLLLLPCGRKYRQFIISLGYRMFSSLFTGGRQGGAPFIFGSFPIFGQFSDKQDPFSNQSENSKPNFSDNDDIIDVDFEVKS